MKTRVGIVGPQDSVDLICEVGREFADDLTVLPFIYQNVEETNAIIQQYEHQIDIWVFSGQAPFAIAQESGLKQQFLFPPMEGAGLMKSLLEIGYRDQKNLLRLSFDTLSRLEVMEAYTELGLSSEQLHLLPYSGYKPAAELIDFHHSLFINRQVDACVTCLHSVYEELKRRGVPVYRITKTRGSIRRMLSMALQQGETLHFKKSQIAVLLIQIGGMDQLISQNTLSYDIHRLHLRLQETVLEYTESISGSFIALGSEKFLLFSTRGSLESGETSPALLPERLAVVTDLSTNVGVGYGNTALSAEQNAQLALLHAQNYGPCSTFMVDDNNQIEGPLESPNRLSFGYRTESKAIREKLKEAKITIKTYSKLLSVQNSSHHHSITSSDVAAWLKMTQRNARRILHELEQHSLAEVIGEEAPPARGRPRKIYRIKEECE
ncbi:hypothetical protein [Desmospora activa]|uniref:Transcriptional regulator n=1 Tax=Desmospora activa DSM 45169 TaxID=1121389 RepID=A0A2T4ZAY6_9BACL|nr:hypothetical protein [Desmospora activa]PTM59061.1 hypothetical protein C8J48_1662 [Desmospora activa DSM 45169]